MSNDDFLELLERCIARMREVLATKAGEYATAADRLHNFRKAAALLRGTPAKACLGFMAKHLVSVVDLVEKAGLGVPMDQAVVDEKIGDAVNYLVLLEALLLEKL